MFSTADRSISPFLNHLYLHSWHQSQPGHFLIKLRLNLHYIHIPGIALLPKIGLRTNDPIPNPQRQTTFSPSPTVEIFLIRTWDTLYASHLLLSVLFSVILPQLLWWSTFCYGWLLAPWTVYSSATLCWDPFPAKFPPIGLQYSQI